MLSKNNEIVDTIIMPAGTYYVGDPCYVFDERWDDVLKKTNFYDGPYDDSVKDKTWAHRTKWGDGRYYDENGTPYPVDAGLIGVVHIDFMEKKDLYGRLVDFKEDFVCGWIGDEGIIVIGDIRIKTDKWRDD